MFLTLSSLVYFLNYAYIPVSGSCIKISSSEWSGMNSVSCRKPVLQVGDKAMHLRKRLVSPIKVPLRLLHPRCLIPHNKNMEPLRILVTAVTLLSGVNGTAGWLQAHLQGWRRNFRESWFPLLSSTLEGYFWLLTLLLCALLRKLKNLPPKLCISRLAANTYDTWINDTIYMAYDDLVSRSFLQGRNFTRFPVIVPWPWI